MTIDRAQPRASVARSRNPWRPIVSGAIGVLVVWCTVLAGAALLAQQSDQRAAGQERVMSTLSDGRPDWPFSPDDSRSPGLAASPVTYCVDVCLGSTGGMGTLVILWLSLLGSVRPARRGWMLASPLEETPRSSLTETAKGDHQPDLTVLSVCVR